MIRLTFLERITIFLSVLCICFFCFNSTFKNRNLKEMDLFFPVFSGLLAAMLHVIAGPDHLAAVIPFAVEQERGSWKIGLFWSIGHLLGMFIIGVLFLLFRDLIPIEAISGYSEQLVGLLLIGIGLWALYRVLKRDKAHRHLHVHSSPQPHIHKHPHGHEHDSSHDHTHKKLPRQSNMASLGIGILHGLAGIAHFLLFLPVLGFETRSEAFSYVIGFSVGIILAMVGFTLIMGMVAELARNWHHKYFLKGLRLAVGFFALIIGVYWLLAN
jgi:ABC-type nickel/cobalt efflux system permease component RcnA